MISTITTECYATFYEDPLTETKMEGSYCVLKIVKVQWEGAFALVQCIVRDREGSKFFRTIKVGGQ